MKLTPKEIESHTTFASELAAGAGKILRQGFGRTTRVTFKGRIDPVTEYDLKSEKYITSRIVRKHPTHSILAEEGNDTDERSSYRWVIDPLDGTVNYSHGFPMYCVSIALEYDKAPVAAAIYDPEREELFTAGLGLGSRLNGKRIHVSGEKRLDRSLLATGFSYSVDTDRKNNLGLFARMVKKAQAVRRPGSAAIDLCWLACGRLDGFWELYLHPWDTAAARLIVTEAGGRVSRISGREYSITAPDILASNGHIHRLMQKALTKR